MLSLMHRGAGAPAGKALSAVLRLTSCTQSFWPRKNNIGYWRTGFEVSWLSVLGRSPTINKLSRRRDSHLLTVTRWKTLVCGSEDAAMSSQHRGHSRVQADDFLSEGPQWYSPKWSKFVFTETANRFFVIRSDNSSPEEFVEELERRSQEHYRKIGKGT